MKTTSMKRMAAALLVLLPLSMWAEVVQIGALYYEVTTSSQEAVVRTPTGGTAYSGDITVPATVEVNGIACTVTVDKAAFQRSGITSVTFEEGFTRIEAWSFLGCTSLTSVTIPESVTFIDGRAFADCTALTQVNIPAGITKITDGLFYRCSSLASITLPAGLTEIGQEAFDNCTALAQVNIPEGVTSIGYRAFRDCESLSSVTLPAGLATIGASAFYDCGLTKVVSKRTVPVDISQTSPHPFGSPKAEAVLTVPYGTREAYIEAGWTETVFKGGVVEGPAEVDGLYYRLDDTTHTATLIGDADNRYAGDVVVPPSVTYLGQSYTVTAIDQTAFDGDALLTSVTLPESVTELPYRAFQRCTSLAQVTLPPTLTLIGPQAFGMCTALTSITLPENLDSIGVQAFAGCRNLAEIEVLNATPPALGGSAFTLVPNTCTVYVPVGSKAAYEAAWTYFTNIVERGYVEIDGIRYIPDTTAKQMTVTGESGLYAGHLVVPETVEYRGETYTVTGVGSLAFRSSRELLSVSLPETIEALPNAAFSGCSALTEVNIPAGVSEIPMNCFTGCTSLTSITLHEGITSIAANGFLVCFGLKSVVSKIREPFELNRTAFQNISEECVLTVPRGTRQAYLDMGWTEEFFKGGVVEEAPDLSCVEINGLYYSLTPYADNATVVSPPEGKYQGEYVIPSTVEYEGVTYKVRIIGEGAFRDCVNLQSVRFVDADGQCNLTTIMEGAFEGCTQLQRVTLPPSLEVVNQYAFRGCSGLRKVVLRNAATFVVHHAFVNNALDNRLYVPTGTKASMVAFAWAGLFGSIVEMGDANADGVISITDVGLMIDHILGTAPEGYDDTAADVNQDETVSITDVGLVIDAILNQ